MNIYDTLGEDAAELADPDEAGEQVVQAGLSFNGIIDEERVEDESMEGVLILTGNLTLFVPTPNFPSALPKSTQADIKARGRWWRTTGYGKHPVGWTATLTNPHA